MESGVARFILNNKKHTKNKYKQNITKKNMTAKQMQEMMFVFRLILYSLVGVTNDKIAQIEQYCLKSG